MLYAISEAERNLADRTAACNALRNLVMKLLSCIGSLELSWPTVGLEGGSHWTFVAVGLDLVVDCSTLWTTEFEETHVQDAWLSDLRNASKPWVRTPLTNATLDQLLCFALDPMHQRGLKSSLRPGALTVLSQIAFVLDDAVTAMAGSNERPPRSSFYKKFTALALMEKRDIANRMFNGEDSGCSSEPVSSKTQMERRDMGAQQLQNKDQTSEKAC
ncbi:unnamed protein product [Symbiodinium natans]|uniref:Uncharacterized protein n=1 Tax=Symbiodinium natans TaxID=878477 RepID=A0A812VBK7_9DINO|nr:unnamed protein product [Symbiodinium natans]